MIGGIAYSYIPDTWSQEEFLRLGGFTVVFLNYNKARYIEKSVASALAQDYPLCEMFFMDDASTDGSGDTMERIVREYRGRHKVTVVRNDENQHICGQWKIVAKLATGNWFGMFCGDDIAHPDRISKVAAIIKENPSLRGVCTSARTVNAETGVVGGRLGDVLASEQSRGTDVPLDVAVSAGSAVGATTFYRRELFESPLPFAKLDDELLRWIGQLKGAGDSNIVWKFAMDVDTVDYTCGSGISQQGLVNKNGAGFTAEDWRKASAGLRRFTSLKLQAQLAAQTYFRENDASHEFLQAVEISILRGHSIHGNTFTRLFWIFPKLVFRLIVCRGKWSSKYLIVKSAAQDLLREILGVAIWSKMQVWRSSGR